MTTAIRVHQGDFQRFLRCQEVLSADSMDPFIRRMAVSLTCGMHLSSSYLHLRLRSRARRSFDLQFDGYDY